jgi:glutamine synthetase
MASQIYAGLDGIARHLDPGASADTPYETKAKALPKNLGEALAALRASAVYRQGFGNAFVDYFARIKEAELARFTAESKTPSDPAEVTVWEQDEYFDLF